MPSWGGHESAKRINPMPLYEDRVKRTIALMMTYGMDAIILNQMANMFYLTGDRRLCAYAVMTRGGFSEATGEATLNILKVA
jgi:Xaa-Pro aminopeptidase